MNMEQWIALGDLKVIWDVWIELVEWKELAHVVDRLFFAVVFTLMTITVLIIVLVPFYKDNLPVATEDAADELL